MAAAGAPELARTTFADYYDRTRSRTPACSPRRAPLPRHRDLDRPARALQMRGELLERLGRGAQLASGDNRRGASVFLLDAAQPRGSRLERAIGVVVYRPETERISYCFNARLGGQSDALFPLMRPTRSTRSSGPVDGSAANCPTPIRGACSSVRPPPPPDPTLRSRRVGC
jgi:hypothetical protein